MAEAALTSPMTTGGRAEALAIAELLGRGHRVAIPLVDDDEVDLVVNYRLAVQVKSAHASVSANGRRTESTYSWRVPRATHVDVVMLYAFDIDAWWLLPGDFIRALKRTRVATTPDRGNSGRPSVGLERWRDAWQLLDVV